MMKDFFLVLEGHLNELVGAQIVRKDGATVEQVRASLPARDYRVGGYSVYKLSPILEQLSNEESVDLEEV